jgi:hypothetical protein
MDISRGNELGCHGPRRLRTLEDLLPSCIEPVAQQLKKVISPP